MGIEFVTKIGEFLKPRLKQARVTIDKLAKKCFKTGQKTFKMLKEWIQVKISQAKAKERNLPEGRRGISGEEGENTSEEHLEMSRGEGKNAARTRVRAARSGPSAKMQGKEGLHEEGFSRTFYAPERYAPTSVEDFVDLIKHTPVSVLSKTDRARIAAVMSLGARRVRDLMAPREKMIFVREVDLLGPIMLDRLYKSGLTSFPVVDSYRHLKGVLHTEELNALEIKETERASKYMDKAIYYLKDTDSLEHAIEEMKRKNNFYFFVVNKDELLVGFITVEMILNYFMGK